MIHFFDTPCKESVRTDNLFGICDDQNGEKAYTEVDNSEKWIAIIKNEQQIEVTFTAIDNCIILLKEGTNDQEKSCDGMITFLDSIYLVELKNQGSKGWIPGAFKQLESTIKFIQRDPNFATFKYKKAIACNRKRKYPRFTTIDSERNKRFFKTYGFRIGIQAEIIIKT